MTITIEDVIRLQHNKLDTTGKKIVYLTIQDRANEDGWSAISLNAFGRLTGLSPRGVHNILKGLINCGLLETNQVKERVNSTNVYRVIKL
jgi:hypothetical protein